MQRFENVKDITIDAIKRMYENDGYEAIRPSMKKVPENHVFDEDKSVKWNREAVINWNNEVKQEMQNYRKRQNECHEELMEDIAQYLCNNYCKINHAQGLFLARWCYEEYHSCMSDFFINIYHIADFYECMFDLVDKED